MTRRNWLCRLAIHRGHSFKFTTCYR